MKSDNLFVRYKYAHGLTVATFDNLKSIIEDQKFMFERDCQEWIDNDDEFLPRHMFAVTYIGVNFEGELASLELTEVGNFG